MTDKEAKQKYGIAGIVNVDERGQMVLPADVRKRLGIKGGDKLAVIPCGGVDCPSAITLMRVEELTTAIKQLLGPALKDLLE